MGRDLPDQYQTTSYATAPGIYYVRDPAPLKLRPYGAIQICLLLLLLLLAHQHKACRQLKIKQEMTAVGINRWQ